MKIAAIPIVQGIPGSVLLAMTGALITERVYLVPGAGGLLIDAINQYDNAVMVAFAYIYPAVTGYDTQVNPYLYLSEPGGQGA